MVGRAIGSIQGKGRRGVPCSGVGCPKVGRAVDSAQGKGRRGGPGLVAQTLENLFSAASKPNFVAEVLFCSIQKCFSRSTRLTRYCTAPDSNNIILFISHMLAFEFCNVSLKSHQHLLLFVGDFKGCCSGQSLIIAGNPCNLQNF